jgi:hypothetical protein
VYALTIAIFISESRSHLSSGGVGRMRPVPTGWVFGVK